MMKFSKLFSINKGLISALLLLLFTFQACTWLQKQSGSDKDSQVIARVHDVYLYEEDLVHLFSNNPSPEDSVLIRRNFIDNWIKEQLVFHKALENLTEKEKDKSKELSDYYHSLIKYEYEKKLVGQRLDSEVHDSLIEDYYNKNQEAFELKECLLRLSYIRLPLNAPDLNKVRKWYKSDETSDLDMLYHYCLGNAEKFWLDDQKWFYLNEIQSQVPLTQNVCSINPGNFNFEVTDTLSHYFISVKEVKRVGDIPPLEFERERIRNIILNKRRMTLINNIEQQIFEEAFKKDYFKIYEQE